MKKKTKLWIGIGICICILGVIGITYALWNKVFLQSGENLVNSDCFELTFEEKDGIQIENSFPMYDNDGKKLKPYIFTISNKCNNEVDYQLNLETTNNTTLKDNYIKVMLNDSVPYLYSSKEEVDVTITNGKGARVLESGILKGKEVKEYELRVWMDEKVTQNDEGAMNGVFESKITVTATYRKPTLASIIKSQPIVTSGNGLYEVHHEDAEITYTDDVSAQNLLKETELRYAGSNPNNYVLFNNELWRIIGLVNTPEGQRIKIIRDESIGEYSWDSSESGINNGYGVNEWSQADLKNLLNEGVYYNRGNGTCYNAQNNGTVSCDFRESGLMEEAKEMIDTITWNLGSNDGTIYTYNNINTGTFYNLERSSHVSKKCSGGVRCSDVITRATTWVGKIGLIYSSDYGYATSGGNSINRELCLSDSLYRWVDSSLNDCKSNNWLYVSDSRWIISPFANLEYADTVFSLNQGFVSYYVARDKYNVYPSLYLKQNVVNIAGDGTKDSPFILAL